MPFSCARTDLFHQNLAVLQGRRVAGIDDARAVEAVFAVLASPLAAMYGLDEASDDGEMAFAGFYLGRYHGGDACHVGMDADGVAGTVVSDLHLGAAVGAVEGYAEVVARLTVDGPAGLQGQRGPAREAQEGRRQVLDLVGIFASHEAGADPTAASLRTELGVGCAAHALDGGFAHQVEGHVHHVHAEVDERSAPGELFAGEPAAHPGDTVAAHPGRLGVVDPTQVSLLDVPLEGLHVPPLALGEGDVDRPVRGPGRINYLLRLAPGARKRFLAENMATPFEGGNGDRRVQMIRGPDAHDVEVVARDEILPTRVQIRHPVGFTQLAQAVSFEPGQGHGLDAGNPHEILQMLLASVAEADHPGAQGFYGRCFGYQLALLSGGFFDLTLPDRFRVAVNGHGPRRRCGPADGVPDDTLHVGVVVGRVLLVARAEVEDPAPPPSVTEPAPEDLAPTEMAHEDELVGLRHVEGLPIHLLTELYVLPETFGYGMAWGHDPEALRIIEAPLQIAGRTHEPLEDLREVPRMEHDQAHPTEHPLVHLVHGLVGDLIVGHVPPPQENVRRVEHLLGQPMLGLVEGGGADLEAGLLQNRGERAVDAFGVDLRDVFIALLVPVLVPDGYMRPVSQNPISFLVVPTRRWRRCVRRRRARPGTGSRPRRSVPGSLPHGCHPSGLLWYG